MMLSIEYEYAHTFETLILRIELPYFDADLYTS